MPDRDNTKGFWDWMDRNNIKTDNIERPSEKRHEHSFTVAPFMQRDSKGNWQKVGEVRTCRCGHERKDLY